MTGSKSMSVGRLSIELVADTVEYVNKLKDADQKTKEKLGNMEKSHDKAARSSKKMGKQANAASDRLKNMAQSAALVTGPLGGIASRLTILANIMSGGPLIAGTVAFGVAITGTIMALSNGVKVFDKTVLELGRLEAQMQITGHAVGFTTEHLDMFARKLGLDTLTSTTEARKAMTMLMTTTSLTGSEFKRTMVLAQDMAEAGIGNITTNAKTLAIALKDPIEGMTRLKRSNVQFTEEQKHQIETLTEAGDKFSANKIILDEVAKSYGDLAKKMFGSTKTMAEATDALDEVWNNFTESFGKLVQPHVVDYIDNVNGLLQRLHNLVDEDFTINMTAEDRVSGQIENQFGTLNDIIKNNSIDELTGEVINSEDKLAMFETRLERINQKLQGSDWDWRDVQDYANAIDQSNDALTGRGLDLNQLRDEAVYMQNQTKIAIAEEKIRIKALEALQAAAITGKANIEQDAKDQQFKKDQELDKKNKKALAKAIKNDGRDRQKGIEARIKGAEAIYGAEAEMMNKFIDGLNVNATFLEFLPADQLNVLRARLGEVFKMTMENEKKLIDAKKAQKESDFVNKLGGTDTEAIRALNQKYDAESALLDLQVNNELVSKEALNKAKLELDKEYLAQKHLLENAAKIEETAKAAELFDAQATLVQNSIGQISDLLQKTGKESDNMQKGLFLASQALAFAMNVVNTQKNMSQYALQDPRYGAELAAGIIRGATIAGTAVAGVAHGGLDSVPSESTFLLQKGERVIQPKANQDLTSFLKNGGNGGGGGSPMTIHAPLTIDGNVTDESWFQSQLHKHRQLIANVSDKAKREKPRRR